MLCEGAEQELAKALGYAERDPANWKQSSADRRRIDALRKRVKRGTLSKHEAEQTKQKILAASKAEYEKANPRRPNKKIWAKAIKDYASIREDIQVECGGLTNDIAIRIVENAGPVGVAQRKAERAQRHARKKPKRIKAEKITTYAINTELLHIKAIAPDGTYIYPAQGERCACCDWGRYFRFSLFNPDVTKYPANTWLWYDVCSRCVKIIERSVRTPKDALPIGLNVKPGQPIVLPTDLTTNAPLALDYEDYRDSYTMVGRGREHDIGMVSKEGASAEEHNWSSDKCSPLSFRANDHDDMGRYFSKAVRKTMKAWQEKSKLRPQFVEI